MGTTKFSRSDSKTSRTLTLVLIATVFLAAGTSLQAAPGSLSALTTLTVAGQLNTNFSERRKCDNLVRLGREMLTKDNLQLATWYLEKAEKLNVEYDGFMHRFKDSPARLRADLNKLIAARQQKAASSPPEPNSTVAQSSPPSRIPAGPAPPSQKFQPTPIPDTSNANLQVNNSSDLLSKPGTGASPLLPLTDAFPQTKLDSTVDGMIGNFAQISPHDIDPNSIGGSPLSEITNDTKARAVRYLGQARKALESGNKVAALGYYRACLTCNAEFASSDSDSPQRLAGDLQKAGVEASRLMPGEGALAAINPAPALIPSTTPAPKQDHWEGKRKEAVQKLAAAEAAIDRGELDKAENLALAAQDLRVPDEAYRPKDKRPWMVLMEVTRLQNRTGPSIAAKEIKTPSASKPATPKIDLVAGEESVNVAQFDLPPSSNTVSTPIDANILNQSPDPLASDLNDLLPPQKAQSLSESQVLTEPVPSSPTTIVNDNQVRLREAPQDLPAQIISPPPASMPIRSAPIAADGARRLFDQGVTALKDHNSERAWRLFVEAWQRQEELDETTRDQLQGYLQSFAASANEESDSSPRMASAERKTATKLSEREKDVLGRFIGEVTREQAAIRRLREERPTEAWERLKELRQKVDNAEIDKASKNRLAVRVDRTLMELESYIEQNRPMIQLDERNREILAEIERRRTQRVRNEEQLAEFVEKFNTLLDQQRYAEAEVIARTAREIAPMSPVTQNMIWKTQFARQMVSHMARTERFASRSEQTMGSVLDSAVPFPDDLVQEFPNATDWEGLTRRRKQFMRDNQKRYTDVELEIQQSLKKSVDVNFDGDPLYVVLDSLAKMAGINVFLDPEGLDAHAVTPETEVRLQLRKPVSLRSALNLILEPLELSYVIQDEVLRVTSELVRDGDVYTQTYNVADLVIPIPNFAPSYNMGLPGAIREAHNTAANSVLGATSHAPFLVGPTAEGSADTPASASALAQLGQSGTLSLAGSQNPNTPLGFGPGGPGGGSQADFDTLIELITTTVDPESWEELGGSGTLSGFPTNLSLVVAQTQEVHERVADLLAQLRRLQDLQVTIEVRFITLNDDFFERIGVDFDFEVDDNTGLTQNEADRRIGNQGNFDDDGPSVTIGLDPITNLPRADLDLRFDQGSFGATTPTFGGFDVNSAANIGFAILSDIEAFFVIQAAQGDTRTNVLQAPKVTLFNGQQAFISDASQRPFVTSVIPVVGDFAAAHQPVITVLTEGTSLSVQAVVSNDRRFVRLTLVPFFSRIGDVDTFTFNGRTDSDTGTTALDPTDDTNTVNDNIRTVNEGTTVQLPTFAFTTVNTTVSVPDGGTILLGGIKRLSEGRNESGVPVLSKLPYVNRLFRNVGIGRETSSLMMMVTPRIIIQEEEEANVLGGISGN